MRRMFLTWIESLRLLMVIPKHKRLLKRIYSDFQPDILHINSITLIAAGIAACSMQVPIIWHVRAILSDNFWGKFTGWLIPHCADIVLSVSQSAAKILNESRRNIRVVYDAIDLERFSPDSVNSSARGELKIPIDASCVGYIGRISQPKGVFDLIEAAPSIMANNPNTYFLIVGGSGTYQTNVSSSGGKRFLKRVLGYSLNEDDLIRIRRRVNELGLMDHFCFTGPRKDVVRLIGAMDVVALPTWTEGLPRAVIEAMAMGKPVVSTQIDALRELIVSGTTGLLVPPRNPEQLGQACLRFLEDPFFARSCGIRAAKSVQDRFGVLSHIRKVLRVYEKLQTRSSNI